jgi:hypothetical protein
LFGLKLSFALGHGGERPGPGAGFVIATGLNSSLPVKILRLVCVQKSPFSHLIWIICTVLAAMPALIER